MKQQYDHRAIEAKWQACWEETKPFKATIDQNKPKYYILDMFPYISGAGLHVGHVLGYTATDIMARHKRQKGFNVLHPMGWDSFGLPAEQHAMRTGTHPAVTTEKNIANFRVQLKSLGFSYDWDREISTHHPSYYKWTQWIFTKLYEKGLAYEAELPVNWCPALGTVLANEEVAEGKSVEGGHPVEKRPLRQWVLKITEYADRLLADLDQLNWPDSLKRLQTNWIGRSEGAEVDFCVDESCEKISVFTTRPDTLFGVTYMVLAPEHPLVQQITTDERRGLVEEYRRAAAAKTELDRTDLNREKTGVFIGAYAINPANEKKIPIWISDYVLISYGTGAVMAVPAHDERDFAFAVAHSLPVIPVFNPSLEADPALIPEGISERQFRQEVLEGKRCWSGEGKSIQSENSEISLNGLSVREAVARITDWLTKKGTGRKSVSYKLRDWLFSRQRYWGEPFPILHFEDGTKRVLGVDELPLTPPDLTDFTPAGNGQSPLAKVDEWVSITDPKSGRMCKRETNTMPQWAGSCWYYLRFCDPQNNGEAWSPEAERYWLPVDMYVGGVEHAVLHLLYARFWHKVLYDCGLVSTSEPFQTLRNQGLIVSRSFKNEKNQYVSPDHVSEKEGSYYDRRTGEPLESQIEKMSKSKLNGVVPDEIIREFGADSLRLYEMFMGPLDREKIWNTDAVNGCRRFLCRIFDLVQSDCVTDATTPEALKLGAKLVFGVERDIKEMQFNTAIAKMMEFVNAFVKLPAYPKVVIRDLCQVLMPFAPHIAEEIWEMMGFSGILTLAPWPEVDPKLLVEEVATYVVQVNGKVRSRFEEAKGLSQDKILELAWENPSVSRYLTGKKIEKVVYIQDKLLSLVVE